MDALRGLGRDIWFNLGDLDLATHLFRTKLLRDGYGLAEITARLATAMGLATRVLPMSEHEVTTTVVTAAHGPLHYEEWLVRYGAEPAVATVDRVGLDKATPAPGVLEAAHLPTACSTHSSSFPDRPRPPGVPMTIAPPGPAPATRVHADLLSLPLAELSARARSIRDKQVGTRVTYSPKVCIPLTTLCRDRCGYCTSPSHRARPRHLS